MTCIVGIETDEGVVIGADAASVDVGWLSRHASENPKVFANGGFLFGFTTSWRMGQLLQHKFSPPDHPGRLTDMQYLCTIWVDAVRICLKDGGFATKEKEEEKGGNFLIGYRGRLYEVLPDYQIGRTANRYEAVGIGYMLALGALHATAGLPLSPEMRVQKALEAAAHHNAGVCPPFLIERQTTSSPPAGSTLPGGH